MKKLMMAAALAAMSVAFVGCGGSPKVPANTVAAAYVNLDRAIWNAADVVDDVIDELPKDMREEFDKSFKDFIKENKDDIRALGLDWACVTVGLDKDTMAQEKALVVKCDCGEKVKKLDASLEEFASKALEKKFDEKGVAVYAVPLAGLPGPLSALGSGAYVAFVDGKYVVLAFTGTVPSEADSALMRKMIALYKDNDGEKSKSFDELADLGDDAVARVQTADVNAVVDIMGVRPMVEEFAKNCGDADLVDLLTDIRNITLDVNLSDDVFGAELSVDAGSRELAKLVEGLFNVAAFGGRIATAAAVGCAPMAESFAGAQGVAGVKAASDILRECLEADRSGSVATLKLEIDTGDMIEALVPALTQPPEK